MSLSAKTENVLRKHGHTNLWKCNPVTLTASSGIEEAPPENVLFYECRDCDSLFRATPGSAEGLVNLEQAGEEHFLTCQQAVIKRVIV